MARLGQVGTTNSKRAGQKGGNHFQWHCHSTLAHGAPGVNTHDLLDTEVRGMEAPSTSKAPPKGGKTIEDLFKRLPPHGKPDFVAPPRKDETIDEAISRITLSEGLYKMYWMLSQKAQNTNQGMDHKETPTKKVQAAVDNAMHLLAMELHLEKGSLEHTVANAVAERKTRATMQS